MKFNSKSFSDLSITEGAVKSSIEDFIYDLPKEAIEELKVIMKEKYGSSRTNKLIKIRGKYKLPTQVMGYPTVQLINDYFNTYFGKLDEGKVKDENKAARRAWEIRQGAKAKGSPQVSGGQQAGYVAVARDRRAGLDPYDVASRKNAHHDRRVVKEDIELDEESNTIPNGATIVSQNLQKKTITFTWYDWDTSKWIEREVPQDEAPGFYARAGNAMKTRKTDKYGNLLKAPVSDIDAAKRAKEIEAISARNIATAKDLLNTINKKKTGTKFELYGTKNGKEHTLKIRKSMLMAQVVYLTTGDREVMLQATASGLTVLDKKTHRPLLSGGVDMIWESIDLIDVGRMVIEVTKEIIAEAKEYILWGLPKGKKDPLYQEILSTQSKTPAQVEEVKRRAAKEGWHSFRVQILDMNEPLEWNAKKMVKEAAEHLHEEV